MRRALLGPFGPTVLASFLALVPAVGAVAENAEFENVASEGSQIAPAGAGAETNDATKNLNTVPDDGFGPNVAKGVNNRLVRQLQAARPNEDLIICIAGCFSGRDRVVYAQPIESPAELKKVGLAPDMPWSGRGEQNVSAIEAGDGALSVATASTMASRGTRSQDPQPPSILNRGAAAIVGASSDQDAATEHPSQVPASGSTIN